MALALKMHDVDPDIYRAPLVNGGSSSEKVAGSYIVYLRPGYSFEQHKTTVSGAVDLEQRVAHVWPRDLGLTADCVSYCTKDVDDTALAVIRADPGVEMVECDSVVTLDMGMAGTDVE